MQRCCSCCNLCSLCCVVISSLRRDFTRRRPFLRPPVSLLRPFFYGFGTERELTLYSVWPTERGWNLQSLTRAYNWKLFNTLKRVRHVICEQAMTATNTTTVTGFWLKRRGRRGRELEKHCNRDSVIIYQR